ncbi:hypothetical protein AALM99_02645 [Lactococcus muris]|uniref:Uncharacterized protein n=1 Tax=Lactococcus muris TaxID=2941330 RepID=A0ABV4D6F1_9LACT
MKVVKENRTIKRAQYHSSFYCILSRGNPISQELNSKIDFSGSYMAYLLRNQKAIRKTSSDKKIQKMQIEVQIQRCQQEREKIKEVYLIQ